MASISFFVEGIPKSTQTGSVIKAGGRSFPVRRNTPWSALCGFIARQHAPRLPFDGPVKVEMTFCMPRPKGKGRMYPTVRPDIDGLCKGILDSWNGVLWRDDAQVVQLLLMKTYDIHGKPGIAVEVTSPP